MDSDTHFSTIGENSSGDLYIIIPEELVEEMGWEMGDDVELAETSICNDDGEVVGLTLVNVTKESG